MRYNDEYADQAFNLSLLGLTNKEMASFFGISNTLFDKWLVRHPEFREAVKCGKLKADTEVARAMYKKALGYEVYETKAFMYKGHIYKTKVKKHIQPDAASQQFWLTNRQPQLWKRAPTHEGDDAPPMSVTFEVVDARKKK